MSKQFLVAIDLTKNELLNARMQNLASAPASPGVGQNYYDTTLGKPRIWTGSEWADMVGADGTVTGVSGTAPISSTGGTTPIISIADVTTVARGAMLAADKVKLNGIAAGATANDTNAQLRDRATHTGTQPVSSLSDHTKAVHDALGLDAATVEGNTAAQLRARSTHTGTQTAATISNFDTQVRTSRLDQLTAPSAAVQMNSQKLTGLADGTNVTDAITFGQVQAITQGQIWKEPVRVATTANITLSGTQTIDGTAVVVGNRVLVKNQTSAGTNGIYIVASGAWTRAVDMDTAAEATNATVLVQTGAVNSGDVFTQTATIATLGTTAQVWTQTGEGNTIYSADGTTLAQVGTTFSIADGGVVLTSAKVVGVLPGANGGTGHASNAVGDLLTGSTAANWARLPAVAAGNALLSGGVGASPAWGKVGLTTHVAGTLPIASGGTGATSVAAARSALDATTKFAIAVGTGSATDIVVTHNLGTRDVSVSVFRATTPWDEVFCDVELTTINTTTLRFSEAPSSGQYRCVVVG